MMRAPVSAVALFVLLAACGTTTADTAAVAPSDDVAVPAPEAPKAVKAAAGGSTPCPKAFYGGGVNDHLAGAPGQPTVAQALPKRSRQAQERTVRFARPEHAFVREVQGEQWFVYSVSRTGAGGWLVDSERAGLIACGRGLDPEFDRPGQPLSP